MKALERENRDLRHANNILSDFTYAATWNGFADPFATIPKLFPLANRVRDNL